MTLSAKDSESLFLNSGDKMTVVATGSCNVARFVGNELGDVDAEITCLVKGVNAVDTATTSSTSNGITVTAAP